MLTRGDVSGSDGLPESERMKGKIACQEGYPKLFLKKYKPIAARNEDANVSRGLR
jgi:hypothetical protein